jgi:hypothetical protein
MIPVAQSAPGAYALLAHCLLSSAPQTFGHTYVCRPPHPRPRAAGKPAGRQTSATWRLRFRIGWRNSYPHVKENLKDFVHRSNLISFRSPTKICPANVSPP